MFNDGLSLISDEIEILSNAKMYELSDEMKKINRSSNIALIALIVALLAYLELTIIPFLLIFLTSYYKLLNDDYIFIKKLIYDIL